MNGWQRWDEKKQEYHPNFKKRAEYCLKRAKHTCQHCGIKRGEEYTTKEGKTDRAA